ncbi:aspartate transaminase [Sinorhizobium alkalisoli]|uniref:aspartate transaminase n=1 Tax=Sinorhizobium alkalisoli TaxID=1752398 RepID=UPI00124F5352|nr:aspartate transaminase [Sinorhizobium alkalisoli]MCG5480676.1 aspartate transaminase [Sinorhizobium alkalisoli]QFI69417.1 Aspartate aminotransferase [Sinorhizobium alkalisoli]
MADFQPAARVERIKPSPSTAAAARARDLKAAGRDIVDMTVGEPDFDTPAAVKEAGIAAIRAGDTKYTPVNGTQALRRAIAARLERHTGQVYPLDAITVGGGGKQILFLALMASVDNGAEVIIPAPYWVSYPDMVLANEGKPVIVPCTEADGFKLRPEALEAAITAKTRWLILNAPSNPTGATYSRAELAALAAVLERHPHVWVLTDEIYDEIWFGDGKAVSLVEAAPHLADRIFLVNGVSKSYAMTGWRIGYGAGPAALVAAINKLQSQISSCPSSISQAAATTALEGNQSFVAESVAAYRKRRDLAVERLNAIEGISCTAPSGAFYLFVNCSGVIGMSAPDGRTIANDLDFVLYLLDCGVAAIHGAAYGLSPYFRLSIATSKAQINEACDRIAKACASLS